MCLHALESCVREHDLLEKCVPIPRVGEDSVCVCMRLKVVYVSMICWRNVFISTSSLRLAVVVQSCLHTLLHSYSSQMYPLIGKMAMSSIEVIFHKEFETFSLVGRDHSPFVFPCS
eukprot:c7744_g1_i2 orf=3-347(-)